MLPIRATRWGHGFGVLTQTGDGVKYDEEKATWDSTGSVLTTKNGIEFDFDEMVTTDVGCPLIKPHVPLAYVARMKDTSKTPPTETRVLFVDRKLLSWREPPEGYASWENAFDAWARKTP